MSKKGLAVGTIIVVFVFHLPAVLSDWYFYFWWYDVFMHVLGGVAGGFLSVCLWDWFNRNKRATSLRDVFFSALFVLGCVAIIGIGWEWTEALVDVMLLPRLGMSDAQLGLVDTMLDLYFDLVGGVLAWLVLRSHEERSQ